VRPRRRDPGPGCYTHSLVNVSSPLFAVAAFVFIALAVSRFYAARRSRMLLARIREDWGKPSQRPTDVAMLANHHRSRLSTEGDRVPLTDRTWDDLGMDAVFQVLDRTEGTFGQQALYHRLRTIRTAEDLAAFEALVERVTTNPDERQRAQLALARLRSADGYDPWWLATPGVLMRQPWQIIYPLLAGAMVVMMLAVAVWPAALFALLAGFVLNITIRGLTYGRLAPLTGPFRDTFSVLAAAEALAPLSQSGNTLLGPLRADLPKLARLQKIVQWIGRDAATAGEVGSLIVEYLNVIFLVDVNAAYFAAGEFERCGDALFRVAGAVGEIDAAVSVASLRTGTTEWTRPQFVEPGTRVSMQDLRHPLLKDAVPNSIELAPPNGVLVTGSNMSGKTTFIRTVGVNAVLAQTIHTCFASSYQAPVLQVRTCIGRSDDLAGGKSYYLVEVEAVLAMVRASASPEPHLFLFDELFRGTNAVERIASAEAVLAELLTDGPQRRPHLVLAATHDGELVEMLRDTYAACHFGDDLSETGLVFSHRLHHGAATTRNAIALLRLNGAPSAMIERALHRAEELDLRLAHLR